MMHAATTSRADLGLLVIRLAAGVTFAAHGAQKVFVSGVGAVTEGFGGMGLPMAGVIATLVSFGELLGGIALLAGFLTRIAGAGLTIIMLGAIVHVHLKNGFFASDGGIEFVLVLAACAAGLALTGPGRFSIDRWRGLDGA
ncbi:MAG: DoxX family protein [Gemmatimonadota bacterium]|nr:DoxX family protein [Gemmatimonadota bacterium]